MASEPLPTTVLVASILAWSWAALMLVISIAVAIPAFAAGSLAGLTVPVTSALLSVASAFGAHWLRRLRRPWIVLGASAAWIMFLRLVELKVGVAGIVINALVIAAVIANLRRFR